MAGARDPTDPPGRPSSSPPGSGIVSVQVVFDGTRPGDEVLCVGAPRELGGWNPAAGMVLETGPSLFPMWRGAFQAPWPSSAAPPVEFKFVVSRRGGAAFEWEPGPNRRLPSEAGAGWAEVFVDAKFGGPCIMGWRCRSAAAAAAEAPQPVVAAPAAAPAWVAPTMTRERVVAGRQRLLESFGDICRRQAEWVASSKAYRRRLCEEFAGILASYSLAQQSLAVAARRRGPSQSSSAHQELCRRLHRLEEDWHTLQRQLVSGCVASQESVAGGSSLRPASVGAVLSVASPSRRRSRVAKDGDAVPEIVLQGQISQVHKLQAEQFKRLGEVEDLQQRLVRLSSEFNRSLDLEQHRRSLRRLSC